MKRMHVAASLLVGVVGCGSPMVQPEEQKPDMATACDSSQYPCGPFGVVVGQIVANLELVGRHDDNMNGTPTDDMTRSLRLAAYYKDKSIKALAVLVAAEWCVPCQMEQPELVSDWTSYQQAHSGVAMVEAIIQDKSGNPADMTVVDRWATRYKIPFDMAADPTVALGPYYNIAAFPMQMVIKTSDMSITWQNNGYGQGALSAAIDAVLNP